MDRNCLNLASVCNASSFLIYTFCSIRMSQFLSWPSGNPLKLRGTLMAEDEQHAVAHLQPCRNFCLSLPKSCGIISHSHVVDHPRNFLLAPIAICFPLDNTARIPIYLLSYVDPCRDVNQVPRTIDSPARISNSMTSAVTINDEASIQSHQLACR